MQSQNPELVIRQAVFGDRWKIYKRTRLIFLDFILGFGVFNLMIMTSGLFRILELAANDSPQYVIFYSVPYLITIGILVHGLHVRQRLAKDYQWTNTWIAERRNGLLAIACIRQQSSYSILTRLFVNLGNRRCGIGSQLVQNVVEQTPKPIYLICDRTVVRFYIRLGFESIRSRNAPPEFRYQFLYKVLVFR